MLAANCFTDHKMHHSNINHMHKVLTASKMSELFTLHPKNVGTSSRRKHYFEPKICKLQSGIFQVLFELIRQRNSKSRQEFFPELTQKQ